ncbi:MAG: hypothetical protein K0R64_1483 [Novosphingobium lindaniclasticum]|jgi:prophage regulatory protein|uniref:helix-turn-helix transcriptional regulator n=1 Tax=Novosphingobium lindaniclasticum TaxID=1329895 RepID=UPI00240A006F|nr:AlpA family phage regulatory protein [Novosphingobium lindaniclasticum]MDF2638499.1 hypothetical protein [Novosphingobium lindaniclasticum]
MTKSNGDRLLRLDEVKSRVGLGRSAIYKLIQEGDFPKPYKPTKFASRWSEFEVLAWIEVKKARRSASI